MKDMNLLMISPAPPPYGGIANWTCLIQKYIKSQNEVSLTDFINTAPKQRDLDGRSLYQRVVGQGFEMLKIAKKLKKSLKENDFDAVHITTSGQLAIIRDILLLRICKKRHIRSVYHIHFGRAAEISEANTLEWKLLKKAINLSTVTIAIDGTTESALKKYFPDKVLKIPNPFDISQVEQFEKAEPQKEIMFLGWCVKTKGIEELLEAWGRISANYPEWTLRIVGPCQDNYLKNLQELYPCKNVIFDGEKEHDDAMALLNQASIFILPSYTEGFPNVILEAMAFGKPIIATDVGAISEILAEESGIVIPPQDTDSIVNALRQLLDDKQMRQKLADNGYERIRREYGIDTVFELYKSVWKGDMA